MGENQAANGTAPLGENYPSIILFSGTDFPENAENAWKTAEKNPEKSFRIIP
jgi:hypothetical protein